MSEKWCQIKNYPSYQISDHGRVKSWAKANGLPTPRILSPNLTRTKGGYLKLGLYLDKKPKTFMIHQLVLNHFGPKKPSGKHQVCHNDGSHTNNHIDNLRWGTSKENHDDMVKHGVTAKGVGHGMSKLTENKVWKIKYLLKCGWLHREIARVFNVHKSSVSYINNGRTWAHV